MLIIVIKRHLISYLSNYIYSVGDVNLSANDIDCTKPLIEEEIEIAKRSKLNKENVDLFYIEDKLSVFNLNYKLKNKILIFDTVGKLLSRVDVPLGEKEVLVDLSTFPSQFMVVEIINDENRISRKIWKN